MSDVQRLAGIHHNDMEMQFANEKGTFFAYFFIGVLVLFMSSLALRVCLKGQKSQSCTAAVDGGSFLWNFLIIFSGTMIGLASIDIIRRIVAIGTSFEQKKPTRYTSGNTGVSRGQGVVAAAAASQPRPRGPARGSTDNLFNNDVRRAALRRTGNPFAG